MEYVDGDSPSRRIEMHHPILESLLEQILWQMLDGIITIHEMGAT